MEARTQESSPRETHGQHCEKRFHVIEEIEPQSGMGQRLILLLVGTGISFVKVSLGEHGPRFRGHLAEAEGRKEQELRSPRPSSKRRQRIVIYHNMEAGDD